MRSESLELYYFMAGSDPPISEGSRHGYSFSIFMPVIGSESCVLLNVMKLSLGPSLAKNSVMPVTVLFF